MPIPDPRHRPDPPTSAQRSRAAAAIVLCALLWSLAGVATRFLERAQDFEVPLWRSVGAVGFMCAVLVWSNGSAWLRPVARLGRIGILSSVLWGLSFTCLMLAFTKTSTANVMVVNAAGPLLAAIAAWIALREPIAPRTWAAIAACTLGVVWMLRAGLSAQGQLGMALAFVVPLAGAINMTLVRSMGARVDLAPAILLGAVLSASACAMLVPQVQATAGDVLLLLALGVLELGLPCLLMVRAARYLAPHEIALLTLLEVVLAPLWSWLGAGERPHAATIQGGVLVVAALMANEALAMRRRRDVRPPARAPSASGIPLSG